MSSGWGCRSRHAPIAETCHNFPERLPSKSNEMPRARSLRVAPIAVFLTVAVVALAANANGAPRPQALVAQDLHTGYGLLRPGAGSLVPFVEPFRSAAEVAWSPEGSAVAFTRPDRGGERLFVQHGAGVPQRVLDAPASPLLQPVWAPQGELLAIVRLVRAKGNGATRVFVIDGAGRNRQITASVNDGVSDVSPSWSRDGRRILFVRRSPGASALVVAPVTASASHVLIRERVTGQGRGRGITSAAWSPSGTMVAFIDGDGVKLLRVRDLRVTLVAAATSAFNPVWSPDSRRLAWGERSSPSGADGLTTFVASLATGVKTKLGDGLVPFQWPAKCLCDRFVSG